MQNAILSIVKGVPLVPGANNPAENPPDEINLLEVRGGFALRTEDGYIMNRPSLKSGSVWKDTPLSSGRQLVAGKDGNVVETIRLTIKAASNKQLAAHLTRLGRFVNECREFWTTNYQIDPIYIKHQVVGEPGPRFALLYNIEVTVEPPETINDTTRDVTLSIEREGSWRPLAPGANPKKWTYDFLNVPYAGRNYVQSHVDGEASFQKTVYNTSTYSQAVAGVQTTCFASYIDIPAEFVPGDMEADLMLKIGTIVTDGATTYYAQDVHIARWTRATQVDDTDNRKSMHTNILNVSDTNPTRDNHLVVLGTDATLQNDAGNFSNTSSCGSTLSSRLRVTFATATDQIRLTYYLSTALYSGRYMAFIRGHQSSGSSGDTRVYLQYGYQGFEAATNEVIPPVQAVAATRTSFWPLMYMGVVQIPGSEARSEISPYGTGMVYDWDSFSIRVRARRTTGSSEFYMADLILMPIDEAAAVITASSAIAAQGTNYTTLQYTYDTTGYYTHGTPDEIVVEVGDPISLKTTAPKGLEMRGQPIRLKPGVNNRLYFFFTGDDDSGTPAPNLCPINPSATAIFKLDVAGYILPRWSGLRDI